MEHRLINLAVAVTCISFVACNSGTDHQHAGRRHERQATDTFSHFIPADTANIMLQSYLTSINYSSNDTDIQSLIVDVCQLRKYIDSMEGSDRITHIKLMFAHTLSYATSAKSGVNAGYNSNALTVVIAAYDANGDYILYPGNKVLDYTQPCPPICPLGTAASPFLPVNSSQHK